MLTYKERGYLGYLKSKEIFEKNKQVRIDTYNQNPNHCQYCGKILDYKHRNNKYCCRACSATITNLNRSDESRKKQSQTLLNTLSKKSKKIKTCKFCGCIKGQCKDSFVCSKHQLYKSLEVFGFDKNVIGTPAVVDEFYRVRNEIIEFYKKYSSNEAKLVELYGYSSGSSNFIKILKSLHIEIKSLNDALSQAWLDRRINPKEMENQYKSGWHTTWDNKRVYLRSTYEKEYAVELDNSNIKYDTESLRIRYFDSKNNKYRCAIPDFYLPDTNEIIEVKSIWTLKGKIQEMKDKFNEYIKLGYNPKLLLHGKFVNIEDLTEDNLIKPK